MLTFALAAVYGVALLLLRRASRTSQLPLGPFIVLGTLAAIAALPSCGFPSPFHTTAQLTAPDWQFRSDADPALAADPPL